MGASVTLVLGEKSQSVSGNYTDVSWSMRLWVWRAVNANMTGSAVIDGTTVYTHSGNPGYIATNTTVTIASGTHRVYHSSDGTKSINWSANLRTNTQGSSWSFNKSNSGSRTLSRIPRTSGATLSSNTVQMGGSVNVGFQRASSSFTHSVRLTFGDYVNNAFTRSSATSVNLSIPNASTLAKEIPNGTSGIGHVRVTTFSGTTSIGSVTLPITITIPSSVKPSVGTITVTDTTNFHTLAGNFVQNRSIPRVNVTGSSGVYGSTVRSSTVKLGSRSLGSPGSTFTVPSAGTNNLSVTVTDSRGRTATKSFGNVTVLGYSAPVANVTAKRANANNTDNPYGTYLKFEGTTSVHNISVKGVANRRTVSVTRAVSGSSSTTSLYSLSNSTARSGSIPSPRGGGAILVTNSYDVVVTVTDSLGISTVKRIAIPSGQVSLSVGKVGIGAGKIWQQGALDVGGDAYISGDLDVSGTANFVGSVPAGAMMAWASTSNPPPGWFLCRGQSVSRTTYPELFAAIGTRYGGSGSMFNLPDMRARVPYGYSGSGLSSAVGAKGGTETHRLTIAQMPSHNHGGSTGSSQVTRRTSGYQGTGNPTGSEASFFGADSYRANLIDSYTAHTHSISSQGSGSAHPNMPPYIVLNWIICIR